MCSQSVFLKHLARKMGHGLSEGIENLGRYAEEGVEVARLSSVWSGIVLRCLEALGKSATFACSCQIANIQLRSAVRSSDNYVRVLQTLAA